MHCWGDLQVLIWNLIWHPGVFEKSFERYYCWKLKVGGQSLSFATENILLGLFTRIWIETHFPLESPFTNFFKSSFSSFAEVLAPWTTENNDVSSAQSFVLEVKLSDKSFIYDPWGTPAWTLVHDKFWSLSTTHCFLFLKKSNKVWRSWPKLPFCFNFKISPSCQTLSKALNMSEKILLTSNPLSKDVKVSWLIGNSWLIQESPGWKPDWILRWVY